jgi:hypothetical protein
MKRISRLWRGRRARPGLSVVEVSRFGTSPIGGHQVCQKRLTDRKDDIDLRLAGSKFVIAVYRKNASCSPPSTVMTWPVVLLSRSLNQMK